MSFQLLCSVPFVITPGSSPVCPGDAWSVIEISSFSIDALNPSFLASAFGQGFAVVVPILAVIYGVRLVWTLIRSA